MTMPPHAGQDAGGRRVPAWVWGGLLALVLLLGAVLVWQGAEPAGRAFQLENGARIVWGECWFKRPESFTVQCGRFFPADSKEAGGKQPLSMPVLRVLPDQHDVSTSPLLVLHGDDGSGAGLDEANIGNWWDILAELNWKGEVILWDRRGLGLSEPTLSCPEVAEQARAKLIQAPQRGEDWRLKQETLRRCYKRLRALGVGLDHYSTQHSVQDARDLMAMFGRTDWNLLAVSQGTTVAMLLARQHPSLVRSMILDGVLPPEVQPQQARPELLRQSLATLFKTCAEDPPCAQAYPALESEFWTLVQRLDQKPVLVDVVDYWSDQPMQVQVNGYRLAQMTMLAMQDVPSIELLPNIVDRAAKGDLLALTPLADMYLYRMFDPDNKDAAAWSATCSARGPLNRLAYQAAAAQLQGLRGYAQYELKYDPCQVWHVRKTDATLHAPLASNVPVLMLAGRFDPVTPVSWSDRARQHWPQAQLFVFHQASHGLFGLESCATDLAHAFLQRPTVSLRHACTDEPFGLNFNLGGGLVPPASGD